MENLNSILFAAFLFLISEGGFSQNLNPSMLSQPSDDSAANEGQNLNSIELNMKHAAKNNDQETLNQLSEQLDETIKLGGTMNTEGFMCQSFAQAQYDYVIKLKSIDQILNSWLNNLGPLMLKLRNPRMITCQLTIEGKEIEFNLENAFADFAPKAYSEYQEKISLRKQAIQAKTLLKPLETRATKKNQSCLVQDMKILIERQLKSHKPGAVIQFNDQVGACAISAQIAILKSDKSFKMRLFVKAFDSGEYFFVNSDMAAKYFSDYLNWLTTNKIE